MTEVLKQLDAIRLNFSPQGLFTLNLTLAFIMFGVALDIKTEDFKRVFRNPKPALVGLLSQFVMLPLLTLIVVLILREYITPTIAFGMILVAVCPGGNISNFMSSLGKANVALSVSLTAFATISAIILTPMNFAIWGGLYTKIYSVMDSAELLRPLKIDPVEMFKTVFVLLGIPLLLGMLFSKRFPDTTKKILKPIRILSILLFAAIVILAFKNNYEYFMMYIKYIFFFVLLHNALALATGYFTASSFKLSTLDRRTVTIETGIQNSGLALVLLFNPNIFPTNMAIGGMAFIAAWWGIWHILSGLSLAGFWSLKKHI